MPLVEHLLSGGYQTLLYKVNVNNVCILRCRQHISTNNFHASLVLVASKDALDKSRTT
jgi:hypothetical protein